MEFLEPNLKFDPSKPFYSLIISYVSQVHGLIDLTTRGFQEEYNRLRKNTDSRHLSSNQLISKICEGIKEGYRVNAESVLKAKSSPLIGQQRLDSMLEKGVKVDTTLLAQEILANFREPSIEKFNRQSAGGLVIMAWELTIDEHKREPVWEFLRHCRNASAHKGYFRFKHGEPKRLAKWRTLEILPTLEGAPLFRKGNDLGLIKPGDVLYLLADIEKKFY